ncbi:SPOR domain-containing protein [Novosphingobium flavum]|uniref:SPOR domain-containing protein n=1 Tax=Novosphingobium flavum TaxID=1778672 RepID=A0A7X1FT40_9SPHN|nr:RlpA-like double-psi beta-barrel domain-containing protein [Novosphingobium flavum]MBC2666458.1 SPOR domain-containing protein [Novosphingobium flavum]
MRLPVETPAVLALALLAAGCGAGAPPLSLAQTPAPSGPAADYPMVLGAPFTVDGVKYTPADTLNYDQVGYAAIGGEGQGITLVHRTLPLPSYVEVTSLKSGKTVLVRAERRGPMTGGAIVELSPAAAAQLGVSGDRAPIRIRRVNPPEAERALLRSGQQAPERMDTPMSLVAVLMRKLDPAAPPPAATPTAPALAEAAPQPAPALAAAPMAKPQPKAAVKLGAKPEAPSVSGAEPRPAAKGIFAVQVAAFADPANAAAAARKLGGSITPAGKFRVVRITGFASAADAGAALAKARSAGYSDARIQRVN